MPILVVVRAIEPHDRHDGRRKRMDVAGDGIGNSILIELKSASNNDAFVIVVIGIVVTMIEHIDTTICKLHDGMRIAIEGSHRLGHEEGEPGIIEERITKYNDIGIVVGWSQVGHTENACILVVVDDVAMLEEVDGRRGKIDKLPDGRIG